MPIVDGCIRCSRCGEMKPLDEYQPSVAKKGCGACRSCKYADKRAYEKRNAKKVAKARNSHRKRNHERHRAVMREHYRNHPEKYRGYNLGGRYGITVADYTAMLAAQGGCCACCGAAANPSGKSLFVDHDHNTGVIRGIICNKCNRGIASLGDTIEGVRSALAYLERAASRPAPSRVPALRMLSASN